MVLKKEVRDSNRYFSRNFQKGKKGQITLFIIIGITILILVSLIFFSKNTILKKEVEGGLDISQETAYEDKYGMRSYVQTCLERSALNAVELIRVNGGYIIPETDREIIEINNERKEELGVIDGVITIVPGDGIIKAPFMLTENSINLIELEKTETQLYDYMEKSFNVCMDEFGNTQKQGFKVETESPVFKILFGEKIEFGLEYPLTLSGDSFLYEEPGDYFYSIPINLPKIFTLANDITIAENNEAFIETQAMNLISVYSGLDESMLPPISSTETNTDCKSISWSKKEAEKNVKNILLTYIPKIKLIGTTFKPYTSDDKYEQGLLDSFMYDVTQYYYAPIRVNFLYYPEWDLNFDILPSAGDQILPDRVTQRKIPLIPQICMFKYRYKYSLTYPVVAKIIDHSSAKINPLENKYEKEGPFVFYVPLKAAIYGNQKRIKRFGDLELENQGKNLETYAEENNIENYKPSLICNDEQKLSEEVKIRVADYSGSPLDDASAYYSCGTESCYIGNIENGEIITKLPLCINGEINVIVDGYSQGKKRVSTYNLENKNIAFRLEKEKNISIKIQKVHMPGLIQKYYLTNQVDVRNFIYEFSEKDSANIIISGDADKIILYPEEKIAKLSSGEYTLKFMVMGDVSVPATRQRFINQIIETPPLVNPYFSLGYSTINWKAEIRNANSITFYALVNYNSEDLKSIYDTDKDFIAKNGDIRADIILNGTKVGDACYNQEIIDIKTYNSGFTPRDGSCEKVETVTIEKAKYLNQVMPKVE